MALQSVTKRRLNKLIDFMASQPPAAKEKFYMHRWFTHDGAHSHDLGKYIKPGDLEHCGTTACALGWAATIPSFHRAGLKVLRCQRGRAPMNAAQKFFRLNREQASDLFSPSFDTPETPKQWAALAKKWLRKQEKTTAVK